MDTICGLLNRRVDDEQIESGKQAKRKEKLKEGRKKTKRIPTSKRYLKYDIDSKYRDMTMTASEV